MVNRSSLAFSLLVAVMGASLLVLPFALSSADFGLLLYALLAVPAVLLSLVVRSIRKKGVQRRSALCILAAFCAVSVLLAMHYAAIRDFSRWTLWSSQYKAALIKSRGSPSDGIQHMEWDNWGFAGADTMEYLVFNADDSLGRQHGGASDLLPCKVARVRKLEAKWYAVTFFTETNWDSCGPPSN